MEIEALPMVRWSGIEGRPLLIAGPCSAESEAQVLETARRLAGVGIDYFRAGVWKARTRPNSFEGIGDRALPWLQRAREQYGVRIATEVAQAQHIDAVLRHGFDLVWIGARTTANPFSVQELANALRGTELPVLIKNPIHPDLALWLGAVERIHGAGVRALGLIHRGFSQAGSTRYRNPPMWEVLVEVRRLLEGVPLITDPSHICGNRELIPEVVQRALDLGVDGLMVETHPDPDQALSDAAQQVTPERLAGILTQAKIRRQGAAKGDAAARVEALRERIDRLDYEMLDLLLQRMGVVSEIAQCKKEENITAFQVSRWAALLKDRMTRAESLGLSPEYIKALYDVIHEEALRHQSQIMSNGVRTTVEKKPDA